MMEMANIRVRCKTKPSFAAAAAAAAPPAASGARKRKLDSNQGEAVVNIDIRSNKRRIASNNSRKPHGLNSGHRTSITTSTDDDDNCEENLSCYSDHASASCCSSNTRSNDRDQQFIKFADLQEEMSVEVETSVYYSCRARRDTTPSSSQFREDPSEELDSTARLPPPPPTSSMEANSRQLSSSSSSSSSIPPSRAGKMMPTEFELDEFFSEAEKNMQKQFADKYNYDIVKDEPLKGRYDWVRLKP